VVVDNQKYKSSIQKRLQNEHCIQCPGGHVLEAIDDRGTPTVYCDRCKKARVPTCAVLSCTACDYDICKDCVASLAPTPTAAFNTGVFGSIQTLPGTSAQTVPEEKPVTCPGGHILKVFEMDAHRGSMTVFCDNCKTGGLRCGESYSCLLCDYDMCKPCYSNKQIPLFERMGGEKNIKKMCDTIYGMHTIDPLTADFFEGQKWTENEDDVKTSMYEFFATQIGKGEKSKDGRSLYDTEKDTKPITEVEFVAAAYHILRAMHDNGVGTESEMEEVLGKMYTLKQQ